jgi:hypothetical protein
MPDIALLTLLAIVPDLLQGIMTLTTALFITGKSIPLAPVLLHPVIFSRISW